MAQVTITGSTDVGDCFIRDTDPNTSGTSGLYTGESNAGAVVQRSILEFDLSAIPAGSTINSASLKLDLVSNQADNARDHQVYRVKRDTLKGSSTWNTYDGSNSWQTAGGTGANDYDSTSLGTVNVAAAESTGYKTWTLTASLVQTQIPGGSFANAGKATYMVKADTETNDQHRWNNTADYHSTGNLPELVIDYEPPGAFLALL